VTEILVEKRLFWTIVLVGIGFLFVLGLQFGFLVSFHAQTERLQELRHSLEETVKWEP
jgi:hypothetical protein